MPSGRRRCRATVAGCLATLACLSATAQAQETTYTYDQRIPVPPASNYAGSAGGDGWAVAMTPSRVYNVFHHGRLTVACHLQTNAAACSNPKAISDNGAFFDVSGQPGLHLEQDSGRLYVFASKYSAGVAGVVCIDTTKPDADPNPFCGFTALTPAGDAPGSSGVSDMAVIGTRLYAFNHVSSAPSSGGKNRLLCFDTTTRAACAGQPYSVPYGNGTVTQASAFWVPSLAAVGDRIFIHVETNAGSMLSCFDGAQQTACQGTWPKSGSSAYSGSPFPLLDARGAAVGVCVRSTTQCFAFDGTAKPAPAGLSAAIPPGTQWNGQALTIGPRLYVATGSRDQVGCYDFSRSAQCSGFPKSTPGAGYLYTVNRDPQRPDCIWVNADYGASQIQNFDAFGGGACGRGPVRVLASSIVVPTDECRPASYRKLQVLDPARARYTSATVSFLDGGGQPIPGAADRAVDNTGSVDLTGVPLDSSVGLPQFLITFEGAGEPSEVVVRLVWTAPYNSSCVKPGTKVAVPTRTTAHPVLLDLAGPKVYLAPSATVRRVDGTPVSGRTVVFRAGATVICRATTNAAGDAACSGVLPLTQALLSLGRYTATVSGDDEVQSSTGTGSLITNGSTRVL